MFSAATKIFGEIQSRNLHLLSLLVAHKSGAWHVLLRSVTLAYHGSFIFVCIFETQLFPHKSAEIPWFPLRSWSFLARLFFFSRNEMVPSTTGCLVWAMHHPRTHAVNVSQLLLSAVFTWVHFSKQDYTRCLISLFFVWRRWVFFAMVWRQNQSWT